jgi:hypothetical protein
MVMNVILGHFLFAVCFTNALPHFLSGITGRRFPTPFANPPIFGESSPVVNVLWGAVNFGVSSLIAYKTPSFMALDSTLVATLVVGVLATALPLSWHFGRLYTKKQ